MRALSIAQRRRRGRLTLVAVEGSALQRGKGSRRVREQARTPVLGRTRRRDSGAALVEFAVLAPLLLLLLFGIIEFAWLFSQNLDVRHGAREGARLASVDSLPTTNAQDLANAICDRMDTVDRANTLISINATGDAIGDDITVQVSAAPDTLTGFMDAFVPDTLMLTSAVVIRAEQDITFGFPVVDQACA